MKQMIFTQDYFYKNIFKKYSLAATNEILLRRNLFYKEIRAKNFFIVFIKIV